MCNDAGLDFGKRKLTRADVQGKNVIEIGACDVNGSLRELVTGLGPATYTGTDIVPGPGVDEVCPIEKLAGRYGEERFDVVICTEVLEHVLDWRSAVANMKAILKPDGTLLATTRSKGFPYHGYPYDFWRYEVGDFESIFGDLEIESVEADPSAPGVFLKARKRRPFSLRNMEAYELYSVVTKRKCLRIGEFDVAMLRFRHAVRGLISQFTPLRAKVILRRLYPNVSRLWRE